MKNVIIPSFKETNINTNAQGEMPLIAIYRKPKDYPDKYVARLWTTSARGPRPSLYIVLADSLDEIRKAIPQGMVRINRDVYDDPVLVETWL